MNNMGDKKITTLKHAIANTTFQWFIGLLVAIAGVIIGLLALMQGRGAEKKDEGPKAPPYQVEDTAVRPRKYIDHKDQEPIKTPDDQALPQSYTLIEHRPLFIREARTNLSVHFQNFEGEELVSLNISPEGQESSVRPVVRGYTEKCTSPEGVFNVQVLDIDYTNRKVAVQISRKI